VARDFVDQHVAEKPVEILADFDPFQEDRRTIRKVRNALRTSSTLL
jgi:hypothetical protein